MLLREDSVPWLVGSLARSAWYVFRRNPLCLPRRSICPELHSAKYFILHYTHNLGRTFITQKVDVRLTDTPYKTRVVIEAVSTFPSFRFSELSQPI